jgi:hypothetical protein
MKLEREALQRWLDQRNQREALLIFLAGFSLIYFCWNVLFELPLRHKKEGLEKQQEGLVKQVDDKTRSLAAIEQIIASSSFAQDLIKQQQLSSKKELMGKQLKNLELSFVSVKWLAQITNDLIAQQETVSLISMKTFSGKPWLQSPDVKSGYVENMQDVYRHEMEIEFRGTYFNTIAFLGHLEKLPWHLYWDHLTYQVEAYPDAKVVARFYVLSNQKD